MDPQRSIRVGCDVGGTNTDCVLLNDAQRDQVNRGVIAHYKTQTTSDVTDGIEIAVRAVLDRSQIDRKSIACLIIGTTVSKASHSVANGSALCKCCCRTRCTKTIQSSCYKAFYILYKRGTALLGLSSNAQRK